ncbi:cyclopropane-fatty-acyl-phospholipid synthase family protein [Kibdelosporangium persicum]|uniref:Cyclopropane-fatty-acyl-phospholipid synthase n=1 Tax=Kibdelosporangium persicum TaxID=2698649 RepID=A0ABX2FG40_9PSEU|nr:cyclopropane-fatty-acyl-phospholipid synthase family protein [Kibdelosporangium persicum]NRN70252.1 Cyclopropane-fatty-acyl-phospholipid synthase [Kibdelosporangium persicum]
MRIAEAIYEVTGPEVPVEFVAYDGSRAGAPDAEVRVDVRSPLALSHIASAPNSLGLVRAYVTGALEIVGDMYTALAALPEVRLREVPASLRVKLAAKLAGARLLWPTRPPKQERRLAGERHSRMRDAEAISHHYDVSNKFYEWVLGPSMAYTCAVYENENFTLEEAQYAKHDLVARKLALRPGMRLLDVGCGWGGMVIHAAKHYGVQALGVTLSANQAEYAQKRIAQEGLGDLAEVRHLDYRAVRETDFDAISSIGLTEHIGDANLASYFDLLYSKLRTGGRILNHCITRPDNLRDAQTRSFINRYVFPDGELLGPGRILSQMHDTGFEVRHEENLREHYARTLAAWCANLERHWAEAVQEVGPHTARVWRLYMAGSRLGFDRNWIQLHQILGVKTDSRGYSGMPLRPDW